MVKILLSYLDEDIVQEVIAYLLHDDCNKDASDWIIVKCIYDLLCLDESCLPSLRKQIEKFCDENDSMGGKKIVDSKTIQLLDAARSGDVRLIKCLVLLAENPNAPDHNGCTPIHVAARLGLSDIVKILAPTVPNPNVPDNYGITPIQLAAKNRHLHVVKILAPLSKNANAADQEGWTPIHYAVMKGSYELVRVLVQLAKNIDVKDPSGMTALERAKNDQRWGIVKLLDPNYPIPQRPDPYLVRFQARKKASRSKTTD